MLQTRIAPTPSGYLHIGNVYSFIYTWLVTRHFSGTLQLRIDDFDQARVKDVYIDDVFRTLDWLDLDYDLGPSGTSDFLANFSQTKRRDLYYNALQEISASKEAVFYCDCSRLKIDEESSDGQYTGRCYKQETPKPGTAVRLKTESNVNVAVPDLCKPDHIVSLYEKNRDCVIWRKDDLPAYQLVSLVDDNFYDINLLVRGEDLLPSSATQLFMSNYLNKSAFSNASFIHHKLITENNVKLSKSQRVNSVMEQFKAPKHVYIYVGKLLGLRAEESGSLQLLLENYKFNINEGNL